MIRAVKLFLPKSISRLRTSGGHDYQYENPKQIWTKRNLCLIIPLFSSDYIFNISSRAILMLCKIIRVIIQNLSLSYKIQKMYIIKVYLNIESEPLG